MDGSAWLRVLTVVSAILGAIAVLVGSGAKLTGRLGEREVAWAYRTGYGLMTVSMLLFALRGCIGSP